MPTEPTSIDGLVVVDWPTYRDDRGFFRQTYQVAEISEALGREVALRQGNHSRSRPGVLRGFHAEPWDKLVYVVSGSAMAAVADIRPASPTFGVVVSIRLGDGPHDRHCRLFISRGLANSFCTYGERDVDYLYDVSDYWRAGVDKPSVAWDDPDLAVRWPVHRPELSEADLHNPRLRQLIPDHPRWARS